MATNQTIKDWIRQSTSRNPLGALIFVGFISIASLLSFPSISIPNPASVHVSLEDVEHGVAAKYPVPNIASSEAARLIASGEAVLFDVRERREFETGHLPGAIHVDPAETAVHFVAENAAKLRGRTAIFYCSVGVRSSILVERVTIEVAAYGPVRLYNLKGGIFRWFAERRPVIDANGPVSRIDSYDESWGRLLQRAIEARS